MFISFSKKLILILLTVSMSASFAMAKSKKKKTSKKKKNAVLNFEDELITGESDKPELFFIFQKKQFNFKKLIKLRENFLPEMRNTSGDVQQSGSGN